MPKWEYTILQCARDSGGYGSLRPAQLNYRAIANWQTLDLPSYLNQLGNQGWELVGDFESSGWIFKRPR